MTAATRRNWVRVVGGSVFALVLVGCGGMDGTYVLSPVDPKATRKEGTVSDKALALAASTLQHCFVFKDNWVEHSRKLGPKLQLCHETIEQTNPPQQVLRIFDCASGETAWEFRQDMQGRYTHELELEVPIIGKQVQRSALYPDTEGWCR